MARRAFPFEFSIAEPCSESWAAMQGDARARHCERCRKTVYNLAAMTAREIERLAERGAGEVCARITRRGDGSLVMLDGGPKSSGMVRLAASALLTIGAAGAAAQSKPAPDVASENGGATAMAELTGNLQGSSATSLLGNAQVSLWNEGMLKAQVSPDAEGHFQVVVAPGTYDVELRLGADKTRLRDVTLVAGLQELPSVQMASTMTVEAEAYAQEMGAMAIVHTHYSLGAILRHPVLYVKHLRGRD